MKREARYEIRFTRYEMPEHGLVVKQANLTPAVQRCRIGRVSPGGITATDLQGDSVPFAFIPDANYDPQSSITGFIVIFHDPKKGGLPAPLLSCESKKGGEDFKIWAGSSLPQRAWRLHPPERQGCLR